MAYLAQGPRRWGLHPRFRGRWAPPAAALPAAGAVGMRPKVVLQRRRWTPPGLVRVPGDISLKRPRVIPEGRWTYPPEPPFIRTIPFPWRQQVLLEQGFFEQAGRLIERYIQRPAQKIVTYLAPAAGVTVVPYYQPTVPTRPAPPPPPPPPPAEEAAVPTWVWLAGAGGVGLVLLLTMMPRR